MMRTFTVPGARVPAHCTGVGKVLLAQKSDKELRKLYEECVSPQHSGSVASGLWLGFCVFGTSRLWVLSTPACHWVIAGFNPQKPARLPRLRRCHIA